MRYKFECNCEEEMLYHLAQFTQFNYTYYLDGTIASWTRRMGANAATCLRDCSTIRPINSSPRPCNVQPRRQPHYSATGQPSPSLSTCVHLS